MYAPAYINLFNYAGRAGLEPAELVSLAGVGIVVGLIFLTALGVINTSSDEPIDHDQG